MTNLINNLSIFKLTLGMLFLLCFSPRALASPFLEEIPAATITGTVTSETGEPLIGVTIEVKDGEVGAVTDINGKYSIEAERNSTLVFNYIGMKAQEIVVDGRTLSLIHI